MAQTFNDYIVGSSGQAGPYSYSFPVIDTTDIKVSVNNVNKTLTTHYTLDTNNTRITFVSGQEPSSGDKVVVYRNTTEEPIKSTFESGSTIRSAELNENFKQLLYIAQEADYEKLSRLQPADMEVDLNMGPGNKISFEGTTDDAYETTLTVADPTADRTITLPNVTGTVVTTGDTGSITNAMVANGTINANDKLVDGTVSLAKMQADSVNSGKIVDGSITTAKILDSNVTVDKLATDSVTNVKIVSRTIANDKLVQNSITASELATGSVGTAELINDAVTNDKILNRTIANNKLVASSITGSELADNAVTAAKIAPSTITQTEMATDSVSTDEISANAITTTELANSAVQVENIADDTITTAKIKNSTLVVENEAVAHVADDVTLFTTKASDARYFKQDNTESIKSGVGWSSSDNYIATTAAIDARIVDLVDDVGGFVPIANETSFPSTNPDVNNGAGTLVSIKALASSITTGSGVTTHTITNGAGAGNNVTITGLTQSTTYTAGFGMLVETTTTLHTYAFHRLQAKATEVSTVSGSIANINTVGTNIADITTVADDLNESTSEINTVATNITNVNNVGNSIANVNIIAANNANITTVANDLNESTSEIDLVATNITNVNNVGSNISSIDNCNTNLTAIEHYGDTYQVATGAPTQRPDGSSLVIGDLWFDSSSNKSLMIRDGSAGDGYTAATPTQSVLTDISIVSGNITYSEDLGSIGDALSTGTGNSIETCADNIANIQRLGTADAVADMAILATTDVVADMNTLATTAIVADLDAVADKATEIGRLGTADAVADMALLGTTACVADMAILGTADVVSDLNTLATADVVADMNTLAVSDVISDMNTLATSGNVTAMDNCSGSISNINTTAGSISNVNTTAGSISNVNTVAGSIADVNRYANEYKIASSAPGSPSEGDLWYDDANNVLKYRSNTAWESISSGGIQNTVEDTTPELGGHLDCNDKNLTEVATISGNNLQIDFGTL